MLLHYGNMYTCIYAELTSLYIDGQRSGDPKTMSVNLIKVQNLNQLFWGYDGSVTQFCACDIAQIEIYNRALSEEEIKSAFGRYAEGPNCP